MKLAEIASCTWIVSLITSINVEFRQLVKR